MDTLVDLLSEAVARHGARPALSTHVGLRRQVWSYHRLWRASGAVARYFCDDLGLEPGTPVVIWAPNSPGLVAAFFGAMRARLILVPLDATATPDFVARVVAVTGAPVIVTGVPTAEPELGARSVDITDLPFDGEEWEADTAPAASDIAEIVFTSGTTGAPKGVVLTHHNIVSNVAAALRLVPSRPLQLISLLPLSHMLEQTVGLYGPLVLGSTIHYLPARRPSLLRKAIQRERPTALVLVPQALEMMHAGIEREVERRGAVPTWERAHRLAARVPMPVRRLLFRRVLRSLGGRLRFVICGGAALADPLANAWEHMGVRVIEGYGATECAPIVSGNSYWDRSFGTVGRPVTGVDVALADDGEILVAGPNVSREYWRDPVATAGAFDADGRYHTGDLGTWDDAGRLRITGRTADRIILPSGLNVYPADIEAALEQEPEIAACVVLSPSDPADRPHLHAVVIAAAGDGEPPRHEDIAAAVRRAGSRLSPHQRVTGFTLWTEGDFPRTNLGKVKRYEVAAAVAKGAPTVAGPAPPPPAKVDDAMSHLRAVVARLRSVDPSTIAPDTDLTLDLGFDSLGRVELAMQLEEELGVDVEDGDIAAIDSVAQLGELVTHSEQAGPASPLSFWPRRRPARIVRSLLQHLVLFPLHGAFARPFTVTGTEHVDGMDGPVLVIANHTSHLDTPSILRALPPRIRSNAAVAAAADYFYRWRGLGAAMSLVLGTFPFSREGAVRSSLMQCGELVDAGCSIVIYPEGTRSISGVMAPFRTGIGLLAAELGIPVVPIAITGTHDAWPKGARRPRRSAVRVDIGAPIAVPATGSRDELVELLETGVAELLAPGASGRAAATA